MDIIAQSFSVFFKSIVSSLTSEAGVDFGARMQQVVSAGHEMLLIIIPALLNQLDDAIAADPQRTKGWRILRKDERTLVTQFGELRFMRRYYRHRLTSQTTYLLDEILGIPAHAKVNGDVRQLAVVAAESASYAKSAKAATVCGLSRMSVCNYVSHLHRFPALKAEGERRAVRQLYVEADEDHVSLQRGGKALKKLVYIHEGVREEGGRRTLVHPRYLTWPLDGDSDALWEEVSDYIERQYVSEELEQVFLLGDGASWIRKGEEWLHPCVPVLDGFHMMKALRSLCGRDSGSISAFLTHVREDEYQEAEAMCKTILNRSPAEQRAGKRRIVRYLLGNWVRIRNQRHPGAQGCSAEGHVSHLLSARLSSRPLGWSEHNLENIAELRIMRANELPIDYAQLSDRRKSGQDNAKSNEVKELAVSATFRKSLKKTTAASLNTACAGIPILTRGNNNPLYQALHGLLSSSVA